MASWLEVAFAGRYFVLDAGLGLYWAEHGMLVVSDLHLEKSTFLAQFGSAVAPYDSHDTLERLKALVARYRPRSLILLGDTFHDRKAWLRLEDRTRGGLLDLCSGVEHCCFVEGNHDVGATLDPGLCFADDFVRDGVLFSHEPSATSLLPQVIGHFHPKLRTSFHGQKLVGKCFAVNGRMLIMPAFGSFTGGLDIEDTVFKDLAGNDPFRPYLVYRTTVVGWTAAMAMERRR